MAEHPSQSEIESLLADLRSDDHVRRYEAAKRLGQFQPPRDDVIAALKAAAEADGNSQVRQAALDALQIVAAPNTPREVTRELSRNEQLTRFAIGFVGWFLINGLLWWVAAGKSGVDLGGEFGPGMSCLLMPMNLVVLIGLAFIEKRVAFGMLCAIALNILLALILGIGTAGWCFVPVFTPGLHG